jgi:hypothetical protein
MTLLEVRQAVGQLGQRSHSVRIRFTRSALQASLLVGATSLALPMASIVGLVVVGQPAVVQARDGVVGFSCEAAGKLANWSFSVDFENAAVIADVPVNWAWVTHAHILFVHAVFANGRQYLTQQYTLDRRSGRLEVCDYASADEMPSPCEATLMCRPNSLTYDHAF